MAYLQINYLTGDAERRELTKQQPVSIGAHKTNDLQIDEEGVELIHCRISWNKNAFEAVAAGVEPIDVNGNLVQKAALGSGDVLRIGSLDITFKTGDEAEESAAPAEGFGLRPLTDELPTFLTEKAETASKPAAKPAEPIAPKKPAAAPKKSSSKKAAPAPAAVPAKAQSRDPMDDVLADDDVLEDVEEVDDDTVASSGGDWLSGLAAESRVDAPDRRGRPAPKAAPASEEESAAATATAEAEEKDAGPKLTDRVRTAMRHQQYRPGEEDTLRSPFVLMLGGGAAILVLLGVTFWFIAGRQTTQAEYDNAAGLLAEEKYAQAINAFDQFIVLHPRHPLSDTAKVERDKAKIDQQIRSAAPNWEKGLEALRDFVTLHRDDEDFDTLKEEVRTRAGDVALGSAQAAGRVFDRKLLQVSSEAKTIFTTYQTEGAAEQVQQQIARAERESEAAILRHETFQQALADLDAAIKGKQPMLALQTRRDLLLRYPEFTSDPKVAAKLSETLETERGLVSREDLDRSGLTEDHVFDVPAPLSLIFNARSRTDVVSVGQAVCSLAKDCCYGVDTVTGVPVWRRVIGFDTPFFPLREAATPSVVLFDTNHEELVRLNANTGELLWRQPIGEAVAGEPLIDEGQIYLPTRSGALYKVDLQTGTVSTRLQFSQAITGPVPLTEGGFLVVAGDQEVVYTLTKQPLECSAVSYLAQKSDSVSAPLLTMGPYVLLAENGNAQACNIRLLSAADPARITEIASANVTGRVLDAPVIRGRDLFVPSTRERVSAFTISDDPGQPPLVTGPTFQVKGDQNSPIFLATGPDRQLWMASSALRRLQLTTDALEADELVVAVGLSTQPLQYVGGTMFNARQRPFTDAVTFTQTNREELTSDWQAVVGARLLACSVASGENPGLVCVSEAGHAFRVTAREWGSAKFYGDAVRLPLSEELNQPLLATAFGDGQAVVAQGGDEPKLWVLSRLGQVDRSYTLDAPLQAPPVPLESRFVLPVAGKLQVSYGPGQPQIQEYALPSDQAEATEWRQVLAIDESNVIAVTSAGQVLQIRLQTSPRAHLAEITRVDLGSPVDVAGDAANGLVALADSQQRVVIIDPLNLDTKAERAMPAAVSNDVWIVGDAVFVETGAAECHCLDPADGLNPRWGTPVDLQGAGLAGRPLIDGGSVLLARQDGIVQRVDAATGEVQQEINTGATLGGGPIAVGSERFVPTYDGSLIRLAPPAQ